MEKTKVVSSGRKPRAEKISSEKHKQSNIFTSASVLVAVGAIFCASFLGQYIAKEENNISNHSFDTVYAMAHTDSEIPTNASGSVLTGSIEDGEWSIWAYLEYVISKLIGVS